MPDVIVVVKFEDGHEVEYPFMWEDSDLADCFARDMWGLPDVVDVWIEGGVCVG